MGTPVALSTGPSCAAGTYVLPCATTAEAGQAHPPRGRVSQHRSPHGCWCGSNEDPDWGTDRKHGSHIRHRGPVRPTPHVRYV